MGLPRFKGAVRDLIIFSTAIYVVLILLSAFGPGKLSSTIANYSILWPEEVLRGQVWRLVTYSFIQDSPLNFFLSMLGIYFIGTAVEDQIGARRFWGLFFAGQIGSAVLGVLLSLTGNVAQGPAFGSGPATNAIFMAFFLFYRDAPVMPLFIPIPIQVKYLVIFTAAIEAAYLLLTRFSLFFTVQLLGLAVGYVWYRLRRRRSILDLFREQTNAMRNGYYRWKRRRAAKKFQVYMRKHEHDPKQFFDEYGNFKPPEEKDKKDGGGPGGWVN